ncbi:hypothetical protein psyc5s11_28620 [Clostridium gelidum]|uniref:Uncharacterized protein n=1 Tax=Clostridium gelidum TaxID=704125 RepID=A0ABM7T585_9CLOT|nr:hypothetical protein [Clostridium gelidum]BCZ46795.1 hypothetical protein psyc5s11_28620 [Clostridium gelidum]
MIILKDDSLEVNGSNFVIKIIDLHWIDGKEDDGKDLCLHGNVFVRIGDEIIDNGIDNDDWTVSAGALMMLRSIETNHIAFKEENHMLPCCGHFMYIDEKTNKIVVLGCPTGIDWTVIHKGNNVKLITETGKETIIPNNEYEEIIFSYTDKLKEFYNNSMPKIFSDDYDRKSYVEFWKEWNQIRNKQ